VASFVDQYGFLATWLSCIILCYQLLVFLFEPNKFLLLLHEHSLKLLVFLAFSVAVSIQD